MASHAPLISIVIPVFNEELILTSSVDELCEGLDRLGLAYELILAENGSTDRTYELIEALEARRPRVRSVRWPEPNYGAALRAGIRAARGRIVVCEEIDLCDLDFQRRAIDLLERGDAQFIVGSKAVRGARDERPLPRRIATRILSLMLRTLVGFHGTDTHGLKAFEREALSAVVEACVVDRDLFASELVIRAQRAGLRTLEIPVMVRERRQPSINLLNRVPGVLRHMCILTLLFRGGGLGERGARAATQARAPRPSTSPLGGDAISEPTLH